MGRLFFLSVFSLISIVSLARPWIGVAGAYMVAILTPQAVWSWNFGDLRPALWILVPTYIGTVIGLLRGKLSLSRLRSSRVLFLVTLWLCFVMSYFAGS